MKLKERGPEKHYCIELRILKFWRNFVVYAYHSICMCVFVWYAVYA